LDNFQTQIDSENQKVTEQKSSGGIKHFFLEVIETVLMALLLYAGINAISARIRVDGYSMVPTLQNGELVIVNRISYKFSKPKIGDVIVFRFPKNPQQEYIKRIIGLPGDLVEVHSGRVMVNGKVIDEPYISEPPAYSTKTSVPQNSLYVLGDNRNNSSDSHAWGPVPFEYVIGKAVFVYWPPANWGLVDHIVAAIAAP
jgi:signal peptidase I